MNTNKYKSLISLLLLGAAFTMAPLYAQEKKMNEGEISKQIDEKFEALDHRLDQLAKAVDDVLWYDKVGDVANIEKVFIAKKSPMRILIK